MWFFSLSSTFAYSSVSLISKNSLALNSIIAYGSLFIDQSSTGGKMIDVQLPLNFYDTKAKPSGLYQIVISCSTSAYGDFMAGCKSNILYVDNFEWVY